jgi:hypothetical protein
MRKLVTLALAAVLATVFVATQPEIVKAVDHALVTAGVITAPSAVITVQGKRPTVVLSWTDTNTTPVLTRIQRKTTTGDTVWRQIGYNKGKQTSFQDPYVLFGKSYRYRMRDSVSGQALPAWSDSVTATVTSF